MVLSELGRHVMSLTVVARKECPSPSIMRTGRGDVWSWAIIRHLGRAVINWYEVRRPCCNFESSDPGGTLKLANITDIDALIDTID